MLKKLALIAALAAPAIAFTGISAPAQAKTSFQLYLGVPYYDYRVGPDYRYYPGRGWYRHGPAWGHRPGWNQRWISCRQGVRIVRNSGYSNVRTIECNGPRYTYKAKRNGRNFTLSLNSRNGRLMRL